MYKADAALLTHFEALEDPRGETLRTPSIKVLRDSARQNNGFLSRLYDEAAKRYLLRGDKNLLLRLKAFETELSEHFSKEVDEEIEREEMHLAFIVRGEEIYQQQVEDYNLHQDVKNFFALYEDAAAEKMAEEKCLREAAYEMQQRACVAAYVAAAIDDAQQAVSSVYAIVSRLMLDVGKHIEAIEEDRAIAQFVAKKEGVAQKKRSQKMEVLQKVCLKELERLKIIDIGKIFEFFTLYASLADYRRIERTPAGNILSSLEVERHALATCFFWLQHNSSTLSVTDDATTLVMYAYFQTCYELIKHFFGVDHRGKFNTRIKPEHEHYVYVKDKSRIIKFETMNQFLTILFGDQLVFFEMDQNTTALFNILRNIYSIVFHNQAFFLRLNVSEHPHLSQCLWILQQQVMGCFSIMHKSLLEGKSLSAFSEMEEKLCHVKQELLFIEKIIGKAQQNRVTKLILVLEKEMLAFEAPALGKNVLQRQLGLFDRKNIGAEDVMIGQKTILLKKHFVSFLREENFLLVQRMLPQLKQAFFEYVNLNGMPGRSVETKGAFWMLKKFIYLAEKITVLNQKEAEIYFCMLQLIYKLYRMELQSLYFPYLRTDHLCYQQIGTKEPLSVAPFVSMLSNLIIPSAFVNFSGLVDVKIISEADLNLLMVTVDNYLNFVQFEMIQDQNVTPEWVERCAQIKKQLFALIQTLLNPVYSENRDSKRVNELSRCVFLGLISMQDDFERYRQLFEKEGCGIPSSQKLIQALKTFLQMHPVEVAPSVKPAPLALT